MLRTLLDAVRDLLRSRLSLQMEILALRHQLAIYQRTASRPRIRPADRVLWSWLSRHWSRWRDVLVFVRPETVLAWRRRKFREHWTKLSRCGRVGRPAVARDVRDLIRRMSSANPLWGSPRIVGELHKIGIDLPKSTVDFFVVPTVRNQVLFVFLLLAHDRRKVLHCNVTANPTAVWTSQQIVEAFPWQDPPKYLLRDRDGIYGQVFRKRVTGMGFKEVLIAPQSPWQNPFVERLIGSIRRECLDHVIVINERHLRRILSSYFRYFHSWRTHRALGMDCPEPREVHSSDRGRVIEVPEIGGLHHHYQRVAA